MLHTQDIKTYFHALESIFAYQYVVVLKNDSNHLQNEAFEILFLRNRVSILMAVRYSGEMRKFCVMVLIQRT